MTTYYVGKGGSDSNDGSTWALRKLTVQAGENLLSANDTLIIGPGIYRERVVLLNGGTSGNPITWIGDVTGAQTDGIGGPVRITGSDNDITATRLNCVYGANGDGDWRVFRGLHMDMCTTDYIMFLDWGHNTIVEDCVFSYSAPTKGAIYFYRINNSPFTVRRCIFWQCDYGIVIRAGGTTGPTTAALIENCYFVGPGHNSPNSRAIILTDYCHKGWKVKNCTFLDIDNAVVSLDTQTGWVDIDIVNSVFLNTTNWCISFSSSAGEFAIDSCTANGGSGSDYTGSFTTSAFYPAFPLIRDDGHWIGPWYPGSPSRLTDVSVHSCSATDLPTQDIFGIDRVGNNTEMVRGCFGQPNDESWPAQGTTNPAFGTYTLEFASAGIEQFIWPVDGTEITVSISVWRESAFAGNNPRMRIKQPGQSTLLDVDTNAANQWNVLSRTLTPSATPPYIVIELENGTNNDSTVRFDNLRVA